MKIIAAALIALSALAATSTLAQAQDFDHHNRNWHRHHGPVIVVGPRHHGRDWDRDHRPHHRFPPHHHGYQN